VISSGHNDVDYALLHPNDVVPDPQSYVSHAAVTLAGTIAKLLKGDAHVIVTNLFQSFGSIEQQQYRAIHNAALKNALDSLGVKYAWADINSLRQKIVANPANFGLQHVTPGPGQRGCSDPAPVPSPSMQITSAWALVCSAKSPVSKPLPIAPKALFADDSHFASGGHRVLGSYFYCLAKATWPKLFLTKAPNAVLPAPVPQACAKYL
jgi:phospholipase/lecithinase/hemolysin